MKKFLFFISLCFGVIFLNASDEALESKTAKKKIGLCIAATGKYDKYAERLIQSCRKYFLKEHDVHYFIFTDGDIPYALDTTIIYQERLGWPYDTLMRFQMYANVKELLLGMDYVFASDADMLLVDHVKNEILSTRVATRHPGFINKRGSFETNPLSTAYVAPEQNSPYFAGGFYGGDSKTFIHICETAMKQIRADEKKGLIAVWHDESHLNKYMIDYPPTKKLSPAYCYPESWNLPYRKILLALDKNHEEMRK